MDEVKFNTGVINPIEVYKEAWALIKDQYWLIFAITVVGMFIGSAIPVILIGPMICGLFLVFLHKIEGRPVDFAGLFKGFDYFVPSLIVAVIIMVPTFIFIFVIYIPMIGMAIAGPRMNEAEVMTFIIGTVAVELVVALVMVCLHTLIIFAFPLIVDKKLSAMAAVKLSAKAVWQNLSGIAGLFAVSFVVIIIGYLMLCIGVYLVLPLIFAANAIAYRKIFPGFIENVSPPPPPNLYQGL